MSKEKRNSEAESAAIEQTTMRSAFDIARETVVGDTRDLALQWIKTAVAWKAFNEETQRGIIDSVSRGAQAVVDRIVGIIAADGREVISATVEKVEIKDGIKITATCPMSERSLMFLGTHQGSSVLIALADSASYSGTRSDVHPDPDEPELPMNGAGTANSPD